MRKNLYGRQFKRDINERKALFKGLVSALVIHESIKTTEEKAKAIRGLAEKLVTKSRKEKFQANRLLQPYLTDPALKKMLSDIGPRFAKRPGGYTRIIKQQNRFSDNASMATIEWVEMTQAVSVAKPKALGSIVKTEPIQAEIKSKKAPAKKPVVKKTASAKKIKEKIK